MSASTPSNMPRTRRRINALVSWPTKGLRSRALSSRYNHAAEVDSLRAVLKMWVGDISQKLDSHDRRMEAALMSLERQVNLISSKVAEQQKTMQLVVDGLRDKDGFRTKDNPSAVRLRTSPGRRNAVPGNPISGVPASSSVGDCVAKSRTLDDAKPSCSKSFAINSEFSLCSNLSIPSECDASSQLYFNNAVPENAKIVSKQQQTPFVTNRKSSDHVSRMKISSEKIKRVGDSGRSNCAATSVDSLLPSSKCLPKKLKLGIEDVVATLQNNRDKSVVKWSKPVDSVGVRRLHAEKRSHNSIQNAGASGDVNKSNDLKVMESNAETSEQTFIDRNDNVKNSESAENRNEDDKYNAEMSETNAVARIRGAELGELMAENPNSTFRQRKTEHGKRRSERESSVDSEFGTMQDLIIDEGRIVSENEDNGINKRCDVHLVMPEETGHNCSQSVGQRRLKCLSESSNLDNSDEEQSDSDLSLPIKDEEESDFDLEKAVENLPLCTDWNPSLPGTSGQRVRRKSVNEQEMDESKYSGDEQSELEMGTSGTEDSDFEEGNVAGPSNFSNHSRMMNEEGSEAVTAESSEGHPKRTPTPPAPLGKKLITSSISNKDIRLYYVSTHNQCLICGQRYSKRYHAIRHVRRHHMERCMYQCEQCLTLFAEQSTLDAHVRLSSCYLVERGRELKKGRRLMKNGKLKGFYGEEQDGDGDLDKCGWICNSQVARDVWPRPCEDCEVMVGSDRELIEHRIRDKCWKGGMARIKAILHLARNPEDDGRLMKIMCRQYLIGSECLICAEKFRNPSTALHHVRVSHFLEKRWKCPHCSIAFSLKRSMTKHVGNKHSVCVKDVKDIGKHDASVTTSSRSNPGRFADATATKFGERGDGNPLAAKTDGPLIW